MASKAALTAPPPRQSRQRPRRGVSSSGTSFASSSASSPTMTTRSSRTSHAGAITSRVLCSAVTGPDQPSR